MKQLFRQEVINNRQNKLWGAISLAQPPIVKFLTLLLLILVIISLFFLSIGNYTRKETVIGILQPNMGLLRLSAPQAGVITEVLVHEGLIVKKNQPLLRIKSEKYGVEGFELNQSLINQYEIQFNTLNRQLENQQDKHLLEMQLLNESNTSLRERLVELNLQSNIFQKRVEINKKIVEQVSLLSGTGYISELDLNSKKDSLLALDMQTSLINSERILIRNQIEQITNKLSLLPIIQSQENDLLTTQLVQISTQLAMIKQQRLSELRAPADGVITGILAKKGKSVNENQSLLSILPEGSIMQAVLYVPTSAFGFIEPGQLTRLRYEAFPYERYGIYDGLLSDISSNVILPEETDIPGLITEPSYRVVVALNNQKIQAYGRDIQLRSGMKLDADIVIEHRSLLSWLFDPVFSIKGRL